MGRPRREAGAVRRSVASRSAGSATSPPPGGSRVNAVLNCVVTWAGAMTGKPEEEDVLYIAGDSFRAQQLRLLKGFSHMWRRTATLVLIYLTPMGQASPLHFQKASIGFDIIYFWMVHLHTRISSFSNSPRIRSAP